MLASHLDAIEAHLLAISAVPANAGHTLHRGTPREAFIKEFLVGHLSAKLSVGTGEIIDANSAPREQRNQFDIVVYKSDYPKIDFGGGVNGFLSESVVATIEVKSILSEEELDKAIGSASKAKNLKRNLITSFSAGHVPPGILSYVVSYSGPEKMTTVLNWWKRSENKRSLNSRGLPASRSARAAIASESIDGVFVLGKGCVVYDNSPLSMLHDSALAINSLPKYQVLEQRNRNMLWLFLLLTTASSNTIAQWPDLSAYVSKVEFSPNYCP